MSGNLYHVSVSISKASVISRVPLTKTPPLKFWSSSPPPITIMSLLKIAIEAPSLGVGKSLLIKVDQIPVEKS